MAGAGGRRPGAGRPKGSINRRTIGAAAKAKRAAERAIAKEEAEARAKDKEARGIAKDEKSRTAGGSVPSRDPTPAEFDSLEQKRIIAKYFLGRAATLQRAENPDHKRIEELLRSASAVLDAILPYEHRKLATVQPAVEALVSADGSIRVVIGADDANL
jgi:hypothetical protein